MVRHAGCVHTSQNSIKKLLFFSILHFRWLRRTCTLKFEPVFAYPFAKHGFKFDDTSDNQNERHTKPCHGMPAMPCLGEVRDSISLAGAYAAVCNGRSLIEDCPAPPPSVR